MSRGDKGTERPRRHESELEYAERLVQNGRQMAEKNRAAVALGRLGGKARLRTMTAEERSERARQAVQARWKGTTKAERKKATAPARKARRKK